MTTQLSNTKFNLTADAKLSVSFWEFGSGFFASVAMMRQVNGKWAIDGATETTVRQSESNKRTAIAMSLATDLAHAETGEWLRLKDYA